MGKNLQNKTKFSIRFNEDITYDEARVIYQAHKGQETEGDFNKVMKVSEAKKIANAKGLDLIEINRNAPIPILKIYDYTKYIWELKQQEKKKKKNEGELKEIQLSVNISKHDMETKAKHALNFIDKGCKVKVILTMRGRELTRREDSSRSFYEFLTMMGENISYDFAPKNDGNKLITVIKKKNK